MKDNDDFNDAAKTISVAIVIMGVISLIMILTQCCAPWQVILGGWFLYVAFALFMLLTTKY